jgi:hypothetical protein
MRSLPGDFEVLTSTAGDTVTLTLRLELFLALDARLREAGRELVLVRGPRAAHRLFEVMPLESVLTIVDAPSG